MSESYERWRMRQIIMGLIFPPTMPFVLIWLAWRSLAKSAEDLRVARRELAAYRAAHRPASPQPAQAKGPHWDGTKVVYKSE